MSVVRRLFVLVVVSAIVPAGAAVAKELGAIGVCGASGCTSVDGRSMDEGILQAGAPASPPSRGAPFYRVMLQMRLPSGAGGEGPRWEVVYVPSLNRLRSEDGSGRPVWLEVLPDTKALYAGLVRDVRPFPPSELPGVRHVAAPAGGHGGGGVPAWLVALGVIGAVAGAAGLVVRRRTGRLAPAPPV